MNDITFSQLAREQHTADQMDFLNIKVVPDPNLAQRLDAMKIIDRLVNQAQDSFNISIDESDDEMMVDEALWIHKS